MPRIPIHIDSSGTQGPSNSELTRIIQEFAERIQRPVLVFANHSTPTNSMTMHRDYLTYADGHANAQAVFGYASMLGTKPFVLHFFQAPCIQPHRVRSITHHEYVSVDGNRQDITLDYRWGEDLTAHQDDDAFWQQLFERLDEGYADSRYAFGNFVRTVPNLVLVDSRIMRNPAYTAPYDEGLRPLGAIVAENCAFIPHDLIHEPANFPFAELILNEIDPGGARLTDEEREAVRLEWEARHAEERKRAREQAIEQAVQELGDWVKNLSQRQITQNLAAIQQKGLDIENYRARIVSAKRIMEDLLIETEVLRANTKQITPEEVDALKRTLASPTIELARFYMEDNAPVLSVTTRKLLAMDDRSGAYHLIGSITFRMNMLTGAVRFTNHTHQINGFSQSMHAPHVFSEGNACFGSFSETISGLIETSDWLSAIELCIAFLESANTDDAAGKYVHKWPYVADPTMYGYPPYEGDAPMPFEFPPEPDVPPPDDDEDDWWVDRVRIIDEDGEYHDGPITLTVGEDLALGAEITDGGGDYPIDFIWRTTNSEIVRVERYNGIVRALAPGQATISATLMDTEVSDELVIEVIAAPDEEV